jgi:hypothetical protein
MNHANGRGETSPTRLLKEEGYNRVRKIDDKIKSIVSGIKVPLDKSKGESDRFVRNCIDVIMILFRLYGFDDTGYSVKSTYDRWIMGADYVGDPIKYVKWKLAAFYSSHIFSEVEQQEVPPFPKLGYEDRATVLCCGLAYRWVQMLKNSNKEIFESLLTSILYAKKGMPRPGKEALVKAEINAFKKLTSPVPDLPIEYLGEPLVEIGVKMNRNVEWTLSKDNMRAQILRTITELFVGQEYTDKERIEPFFPSTSANYNNTRSAGGVVGELLNDPDLLEGLRTAEELVSIIEVIGKRSMRMEVDSMPLRMRFFELYMRILERAATEMPFAVLLALAEALKTRVISKGPPWLYTALKPLQKFLWSTMKKHPVFTLIGNPVTADYVQERMGAKLKDDQKFLSVDYSDATNEMYSWCSQFAVDSLGDILKLMDAEVIAMHKAMTDHMIVNPENKQESKQQTRGQLMGSIVSFPVLCIINAAICRWAIEVDRNAVFTLKDCPLAINGDDGILKVTEIGKRAWERIGTFCGLSPSVGKVYFSKNFLNINSTTFNYYPEGYEGYTVPKKDGTIAYRFRHFRQIQYVNLGLLLSLKRSGGAFNATDSDDYGSLGSRTHNLVSTSPSWLREEVLACFIHRNIKKLQQFNLPWFIPENLGGLGLPSVGRFQPSDKDLRISRKIYEHPIVFKPIMKPVTGNWKVWKYAMDRISVVPGASGTLQTMYEFNGNTSLSQIAGLYCVEALFRVKKLDKLFDENSNTSMTNYYRSLVRQRKKALLDSSIKMPEPFNIDNFPVIINFDNYNTFIDKTWNRTS